MCAGIAVATGGVFGEAVAATKPAAPADRPEAAKAHFLRSMNCAQAILETYGPAYGVKPETARNLSTGFAGGMATGHECGAVTAAYMVLGLAFGPKEPDVFGRMDEFNKAFKARHGEIGCSQLLGVDMGTREGMKQAEKKGLFKTACPGYVKSAGEILEKILA